MNATKFCLLIFAVAMAILPTQTAARENQKIPGGHKTVSGQRKYTLVVNEGNDSTIAEFNRGLDQMRGENRNILGDIFGIYKSTAAGQAVSFTSSIIDLGVNALVNATRSKRPQWEQAVRKESTFTRRLPMQMEILDFYRKPSVNGPLDPTDMNFNGFGCRQVIEYQDQNGEKKEEEVFYVTCKVRMDDAGKARMLNHSKFEVYVDTLRFNYAICDLPNDSLGMNTDSRIDFSFENREDLRFTVKADITSSWINQALMVFKDEPLGSFEISAAIDPDKIDEDGVFRYYASRPEDASKQVKVKGDCFLVPRSYVGSTDMKTVKDSWGTGQYKVEMNISESCRIKNKYYTDNGKWNNNWKPEWKKIKSRKKNPSVWRQIGDIFTSKYNNSQWVTMLTDPIKTTFIQYETDGITKLMNSGASAAGSASQSSGRTGGQGSSSGAASAAGGGNPPRN